MRIKINGFRCHVDGDYIFDNGATIALKGLSGSGKTTIFQALYWCLYGSMRNIYNRNGETKTCSVTVDMASVAGIVIYRQKRPDLLQVTKTGIDQTYEDDVAQAIIDDMFGTKDLWKACCYIEQKQRCTILTGTNQDRMNLLTELAFKHDVPSEYIDKVSTELKQHKDEYERLKAGYLVKIELFTEQISARSADIEVVNDLKTSTAKQLISQAEDNISLYTSQAKSLQRRVDQLHRDQGSHSLICQQLDEVEQQLTKLQELEVDLVCVSDHDIDVEIDRRQKLSRRIDDIDDFIKRQRNVKIYRQEIDLLKGQLDNMFDGDRHKWQKLVHGSRYWSPSPTPPAGAGAGSLPSAPSGRLDISHDQLITIGNNHRQLQSYEKKCRNLGIAYQADIVDGEIEQCQAMLDVDDNIQPLMASYNQLLTMSQDIDRIQQELDQLNADLTVLTQMYNDKLTAVNGQIAANQVETDKAKAEINRLKDLVVKGEQGLDILHCPNCDHKVKYKDNRLIIAAGGSDGFDGSDGPDACDIEHLDLLKSQLADNETVLKRLVKESYRLNGVKSRLDKDVDMMKRDIANKSQHLQELDDKYSCLYHQIEDKLEDIQSYQPIDRHKISRLVHQLQDIKFDWSPEMRSDIDNYKAINIYYQIQQLEDKISSELGKDEGAGEGVGVGKEDMATVDVNALKTEKRRIDDIICDLRSQKREYDDMKTNSDRLWQRLSQLKQNMSKLDDSIAANINCIDELQSVKDDIDRSNSKIDNVRYAATIIAKQKELTADRDKLMTLEADVTTLQKLKQAAIEVECQLLQQTVDSINMIMDNYLPLFFEDPITVSLNLFKQLKTAKRVKASVNLVINYKGSTFDSVNQLSGGEGDRISLALILALSRLSQSPILLLDECMTSFDVKVSEAAITTLRDNTDKTIICIDHGLNDGFYDSIVSP